jgi:hypothetical protein
MNLSGEIPIKNASFTTPVIYTIGGNSSATFMKVIISIHPSLQVDFQ